MEINVQRDRPHFIATNRGPVFRTALLAISILLFGLSLLYESKAFVLLTVGPNTAADLHQRWLDQQYIAKGQNPFDVCF